MRLVIFIMRGAQVHSFVLLLVMTSLIVVNEM